MNTFALLSRSSGLSKAAKDKSIAQHNGKPITETDRATKSSKKRKRQPDNIHDSENLVQDVTNDNVSEQQCRQILKSHKLKITALWTPEDSSTSKAKRARTSNSVREITKHHEKDPEKPLDIVPQPLTEFAQLRSRYGIPESLMRNLEAQSFKAPTEVQLGSLPLLLDSTLSFGSSAKSTSRLPACNLMTVAPTGSGKTLAFLIPAVASILRKRKTDQDVFNGPQVVVVAPTKELARQIVNESRKICNKTGVRTTLVRKGVSLYDGGDDSSDDPSSTSGQEQTGLPERNSNQSNGLEEVRVKSQILVATPLALVHAATPPGATQAKLPSVENLILDEADVLLDPLFRDQTMQIWNACTNPSLRVGLWSATVGASIEELATQTIKIRCEDSASASPFYRLIVGLKDSSIPNIDHQLIYAASEQGKLMGMRELLHAPGSSKSGNVLRPPFLVFTQTIPRAIALHSELLYDIPAEAGGSARIAVLHADLSETARDKIMTRLRKGEIWVLITTDLLARGIDFHGINGVVNYDLPTSSAAYVHRAGRTGRAGKEGGVAVTLYAKDDLPFVKSIANVISASQRIHGGDATAEQQRQWLLDSLPKVSKKDKQILKRRGVESRRSQTSSNDKSSSKHAKSQISTKGGFVRQMENKKKGAIEGSKRRKVEDAGDGSEDEFVGLD